MLYLYNLKSYSHFKKLSLIKKTKNMIWLRHHVLLQQASFTRKIPNFIIKSFHDGLPYFYAYLPLFILFKKYKNLSSSHISRGAKPCKKLYIYFYHNRIFTQTYGMEIGSWTVSLINWQLYSGVPPHAEWDKHFLPK